MTKNIPIDTLCHLALGSDIVPDASLNKEILTQAAGRTHRKSKAYIRILIAAAVILALTTGTALAIQSGIGSWFTNLFREQSGEVLSPGQEQLIEDLAVAIGEGVTHENLTVMVESALSDDYTAYIKVLVEAPEGVVFDKDNYNFQKYSLSLGEDDRYWPYLVSMGGSCALVEDDDGKNNTITLLIKKMVTMAPESGFSFRDGDSRKLQLENLQTWSMDEGYITLFEGAWSFDVTLSENLSDDSSNEINEIELISEPVYCQGLESAWTMAGETVETYEEVKMTSFVLNTFGATCTYERLHIDNNGSALEFVGTEIVMKDGTIIMLQPRSAAFNFDINQGYFTFTTDAPIILDDVDFIRLPDGVILSN